MSHYIISKKWTMFLDINFLQYDIRNQAGIKIPIFIDDFHFQTVNIDGM